jgi:hypothetical protein
MKLKSLTRQTAVLAASAALATASLFAVAPTPPETITLTDSVTFGLSGANGASSGLFDQVESQFVERGRTYVLTAVDVGWSTTTNTTQARVFNSDTTQGYSYTQITGTNTISLLTANAGTLFDADNTNWTASFNGTIAAAINDSTPRGAITSTFNTGTAGNAFTVTSADGALFNWFIGNGQTAFWLTNANSVSGVTTVPVNLGAVTAANRETSQSATGSINMVYTYTMSSVPEASSMVMGSFSILGLVGAGMLRRRRQDQSSVKSNDLEGDSVAL